MCKFWFILLCNPGTYCRCSKSIFVVVISLAAFIVLYCFWKTSSHSQGNNLASLVYSKTVGNINYWFQSVRGGGGLQ